MAGSAVVVVGASGRAAAASTRRAGLAPAVVDLFADRDTRLIAETIRCPLSDYPHALPELARRFPPGPIAYTGGLENHPDVLDRLAADRELLGNGRAAIEAVRHSGRLHHRLTDTGLRFPRRFSEPPTGIDFLVKRRDSSGGLGVHWASGGRKPLVESTTAGDSTGSLRPPLAENEYREEFLPGTAMSAQFVDECLLGVTEQLVGEPWLHAPDFHYAGNVGPVDVTAPLEQSFVEAGQRLALRGPWGLDFILNDGGAFVLEVNPRYTAAVEVLELARRRPLAYGRDEPSVASTRDVVGKAIYYAPAPFSFPHAGPWDADLEFPCNPWRIPGFADIPFPGEPIRPGQPVLTFFARDSTPEGVRTKLMATARNLDSSFAGEKDP